MSFIYGIINFNLTVVESAQIAALGDAVKSEGFENKVQIFGNIALGICHHPRLNREGDIFEIENFIVVADIAIYRHDLDKADSKSSDIELFIDSYKKWGIDCINHLNGDFAVVLYDKLKNEVVMFRDHFGVRPLTYHHKNSQLIFASHQFGIAYSGLIDAQLSEKAIIQRFIRKENGYSTTVFGSVYKMVPGYASVFDINGSSHNKVWDLGKINVNKTLTHEQTVSTLNSLLLKAIKIRNDVTIKTGVHVSGGIDSTGIACVLADMNLNGQKITGYSWTPNEMKTEYEGVNEKEFIDAFCADKQVEVKYMDNAEHEFIKDGLIPEMESMHIELPVMRMADADEIGCMFSGWGGDEFVTLSTRGVLNYLVFGFHLLPLFKYLKYVGIKSAIGQSRTEILPLLVPFKLMNNYEHVLEKNNKSFFKTSILIKYFHTFFSRKANIFGYGNRYRFMLNLLHLYHLTERMESWALFGERYGIRYKYPLLDKDLIDFWFSVPIPLTIPGWKNRYLYREALQGILTESVRVRPDKGEALRITDTFNNVISGLSYLVGEYAKIPDEEHLQIFDHKKFRQLVKEIRNTKLDFHGKGVRKYFHCVRDAQRLSIYLNCYNLQCKLNSLKFGL